MIIFYLFVAVGTVISAFLSWLPVVTALPTVGGVSLDTSLQYVMGIWYAILGGFPLLQFPWHCFLFYMAFRVTLVIIRLFLGSRSPGNA